MSAALPLRPDERANLKTSVPFMAAHLAPIAIIWTGVTTRALVLMVVLYVVRMWFITAGYHRYFAHRSYKTNRVFQFILGFGGTTAAQKGPLWWAGHHRHHHRASDTERDVHSPLKGFWHSHIGWIMADRHSGTDLDGIRDFAKYPELRFLNKYDFIGPWAVGIGSYLYAGWSGLVVGFFCSTILLWHGTFTVNSLAHVFGRRRYATTDTSRNSFLIAAVTLGEGWHNNHHHYQASARNGFFWWEYDITYYVLKVLSWFRIVHSLRTPSAAALEGPRVRHGNFDVGMFRAYWLRAQATVSASKANLGESVHGQMAHMTDTMAAKRASLEATLTAEKEQLEQSVTNALTAAETFVKAGRRLGYEP